MVKKLIPGFCLDINFPTVHALLAADKLKPKRLLDPLNHGCRSLFRFHSYLSLGLSLEKLWRSRGLIRRTLGKPPEPDSDLENFWLQFRPARGITNKRSAH
jgi:hypothetical protein